MNFHQILIYGVKSSVADPNDCWRIIRMRIRERGPDPASDPCKKVEVFEKLVVHVYEF